MKAELTAEKRPACTPPDSTSSNEDGNQTTHEYEGRVQVLVVLLRIIAVKFSRFLAVHGEEVSSRVIGPERIEKFFEGGMEAGFGCQSLSGYHGSRADWTYHFGSIWTTVGSRG